MINLPSLQKYDRIKFNLKSAGEDIFFTGQFRGRITDIDHCYFDHEGEAIWVTSDRGFEIMANISDIISIEKLDVGGVAAE